MFLADNEQVVTGREYVHLGAGGHEWFGVVPRSDEILKESGNKKYGMRFGKVPRCKVLCKLCPSSVEP